MTLIGVLDMGSLTARALIARKTGEEFTEFYRVRRYIKVSEEYDTERKIIRPTGIERTYNVLMEISEIYERYDIIDIRAVATGIWRKAKNASELIESIYKRTGINIRIISPFEEAELTALGVLNSLKDMAGSYLIFDLGGASTEFISIFKGKIVEIRSIELGAGLLSHIIKDMDPPTRNALNQIREIIKERLKDLSLYSPCPDTIIGTGGTITSVSAILYGIDIKDISPSKMNGLLIQSHSVCRLFKEISVLKRRERLKIKGLDEGRVDTIIPGMQCTIEIMAHFGKSSITVSLSDILEGLIVKDI